MALIYFSLGLKVFGSIMLIIDLYLILVVLEEKNKKIKELEFQNKYLRKGWFYEKEGDSNERFKDNAQRN